MSTVRKGRGTPKKRPVKVSPEDKLTLWEKIVRDAFSSEYAEVSHPGSDDKVLCRIGFERDDNENENENEPIGKLSGVFCITFTPVSAPKGFTDWQIKAYRIVNSGDTVISSAPVKKDFLWALNRDLVQTCAGAPIEIYRKGMCYVKFLRAV